MASIGHRKAGFSFQCLSCRNRGSQSNLEDNCHGRETQFKYTLYIRTMPSLNACYHLLHNSLRASFPFVSCYVMIASSFLRDYLLPTSLYSSQRVISLTTIPRFSLHHLCAHRPMRSRSGCLVTRLRLGGKDRKKKQRSRFRAVMLFLLKRTSYLIDLIVESCLMVANAMR